MFATLFTLALASDAILWIRTIFAQSNGNYIAIFSSRLLFKLDNYKIYVSHCVQGFPIKCNFSLDGRMVASGSSDGCVYFCNSRTSNLLRKVKAHSIPICLMSLLVVVGKGMSKFSTKKAYHEAVT